MGNLGLDQDFGDLKHQKGANAKTWSVKKQNKTKRSTRIYQEMKQISFSQGDCHLNDFFQNMKLFSPKFCL